MTSAASPLWNVVQPVEYGVRTGLAAVLAVLAVVICAIRVRAVERLERMTRIADAAQRAILRPLPGGLDGVGLAARYVSATDEALVGGDLYEAVQTRTGVRLLVGDVRGKGIEAVSLAAAVLGAFRRSAFAGADLAAVAVDLDDVVQRLGGPEDFVTALLVEARDATGAFFDLEAAGGLLRSDPPDAGLDALVAALAAWSGHRLDDDLALVLVEHRDLTRPDPDRTGPDLT